MEPIDILKLSQKDNLTKKELEAMEEIWEHNPPPKKNN